MSHSDRFVSRARNSRTLAYLPSGRGYPFPSCYCQLQSFSPTPSVFPEPHSDETIHSAFARLCVSSDHNSCPFFPANAFLRYSGDGSDSGLDQNSILHSTTDNGGHRFLRRPEQQVQESHVEMLRPGLSIDGVGNVGTVRTQDMGFESFDSEWYLPNYPQLLRQREASSGSPVSTTSNWDELSVWSRQSLMSHDFEPNIERLSVSGRLPHLSQVPQNYFSINSIRGKIVRLAKNQNGCRLVQRTLEFATKEVIDMVFLDVIEHVTDLMLNPFGNYVIQKLVQVCREEQRTDIILRVTKIDFQLIEICLNMHGTRAVQKLLEYVTNQTQISLIMSAISPGTVALTKDTNGHHVIQHCVKHFSDEDNKYLLNEVANNCVDIAKDRCGCCVLQHCVDHSRGEIKLRLVARIIQNAPILVEDPYGNYVVQHLLELRIPTVTESLLGELEGKFLSLSCNKFGSNVVEKCLESGPQEAERIIFELLGSQNILMLLMDPYGNYVIQKALKVSKGALRNNLLRLVQQNSPMMRSNIYGKKVLARFDRRRM